MDIVSSQDLLEKYMVVGKYPSLLPGQKLEHMQERTISTLTIIRSSISIVTRH